MIKIKEERGFTLIEFMISAVILFVALGLAIGATTNLQQANEYAYQVVIATQDAQRVIEDMRRVSKTGNFPGNVTAQFPQNQAVAGYNNLDGERVVVSYVNTGINPLSVTVTVTWNSVTQTSGGGTATRVMTRQLSTLMTQR